MKKMSAKDIEEGLFAPLLSIGENNIYQRQITEGLWSILSRAQMIAAKNKDNLIRSGRALTLPIQGRPIGESPVTFVIYHVPFDATQDKSIGSFDVPTIDHSRIKHLELVRWTIKAIQKTTPQAEIVICTDEEFGDKLKDLKPTILVPKTERNRPMYYRAQTTTQ